MDAFADASVWSSPIVETHTTAQLYLALTTLLARFELLFAC